MTDESFVTYEHVSMSTDELLCAHCRQPFQDGQERLTRITVRQHGPDASNTGIVIQMIHVEGCLPARRYQKERELLQKIKLPYRHVSNLLVANHEERYKVVEKFHAMLVRCVQDYDEVTLRFLPGWCRTDEKQPSYQLLLPYDVPVVVSQEFFDYTQFKAQFERIYTVDVTVVEMNADKELLLSHYFEQWNKRIGKLCHQKQLPIDVQLWTHLVALDGTQKADIRIVVKLALHEEQVKKLFGQCREDRLFAWSHILPYSLQIDTQNGDAWSLSLAAWQKVINQSWCELYETIVPETASTTLTATPGRLTMHLLAYTKIVESERVKGLLVGMNVQEQNEMQLYYMLSADGQYLWCYSGGLEDSIPLVLNDYTVVDSEMERAKLVKVQLNQLKKRFVCVGGKVPAQPATKHKTHRLAPTLT